MTATLTALGHYRQPLLARHSRALREILGARVTAYLGGVSETRAVRQWTAGDQAPGELVQRRMRLPCMRRWRSRRSMGAA